MRHIVFDNPGEIDRRAFTTFGVNAKPNTASPIGYFGTGLKYAIAVLMREGIGVSLWIGDEEHVFYPAEMNFRGKDFVGVRMKRRKGLLSRWSYADLPFTTELGKNWELWQVLRELQSNALDEGGDSYDLSVDYDTGTSSSDPDVLAKGSPGRTRIIVSGDKFAKVWDNRGSVFLKGARRQPGETDSLRFAEYFPGMSKELYYRSLRVYTGEKPWLMTWNVLSALQLTEDRTLASPYIAQWAIARAIAQSDDESMLRAVLSCSKDYAEATLDYGSTYVVPSDAFRRVAAESGHWSAFKLYASSTPAPVMKEQPWQRQLLLAMESKSDELLLKLVKEHGESLSALLRSDLRIRHPRAALEVAEDAVEMPF